ncbi:MAG: GNAT family N-acetyltransferase [Planctomycetota bacterium]
MSSQLHADQPPRFREMTEADLPAIFDVRVRTWHNPNGARELEAMGITPASVTDLMKTTHRGWVCEVAQQIVGFAMGNRQNGELWVVAVLPEHENQGLGRSLMDHTESWLFDAGWDEIWLTTDPDETYRAVGFYRRLGWSDWKIEDGDRFMRKPKPA